MRIGKLLLIAVMVLGYTIGMLSPVTGQTKKSSGPNGAAIFEDKCSTCHEGGENTVEEDKTLKLDALKKNGFNGVDDIKKRVEEGKGVMPTFKEELKPAEIDAVANYVWSQAQKGWKK